MLKVYVILNNYEISIIHDTPRVLVDIYRSRCTQTTKKSRKKGPPKELLEKYDTNKDGKLDKEERSKISPEDRKKMGPPRKKQPRTGGPDPIPEHLKKN